MWGCAFTQFLIHNHPNDCAITGVIVRVKTAPLAFLASFDLTLLLWRDVVIAGINQVVAVGNAHHYIPQGRPSHGVGFQLRDFQNQCAVRNARTATVMAPTRARTSIMASAPAK
jgi:hypothetical protein